MWRAYSAGRPLSWGVTVYTTEGDPVQASLRFDGKSLEVTKDMSADRFSSQADRREMTWECASMTRRPWRESEPQRFSFELWDCRGEDSTVAFP